MFAEIDRKVREAVGLVGTFGPANAEPPKVVLPEDPEPPKVVLPEDPEPPKKTRVKETETASADS
jgi:hypothetical protein